MNTFINPAQPKEKQIGGNAAPFLRMAPAPMAYFPSEMRKLEPQAAKCIIPASQQKKELTITVEKPAPLNAQANGFPQAETLMAGLIILGTLLSVSMAAIAIRRAWKGIRLAGKAEGK
ncbi:MAG: hypothetical protein WC717_04075 [Candidatus Micrarchaeia archaeon]